MSNKYPLMDKLDILEVTVIAPKEEGTVELRVFVPGDLRNKFKGKCATQGRTMSQIIAAMMKGYLTDDITIDMLDVEEKK